MSPILAFSNESALALDLGEAKPKSTTLTPGQVEAAAMLLGDGASALRIGVWECTPGRFETRRTTREICFLLTGRVTIRAQDGYEAEYGPGSNFTLPAGFVGEWIVHETVRKIFIVHEEAAGRA